MFWTWKSVTHVILLQAALAFYFLIWPWLKTGIIWAAKRRPKRKSKPERATQTERPRSPYRGAWRSAQYRRTDHNRSESNPNQNRHHSTAKRTVNPVKAAHLRCLGLREPAHLIDVKSAYRRLAKTYHPDRFAASTHTDAARAEAAQKMRDINAAYDWLRLNA